MVPREKENLEQQDRETCRLASGKASMELAAVGSAAFPVSDRSVHGRPAAEKTGNTAVVVAA